MGPLSTLHVPQVVGLVGMNCWQLVHDLPASVDTSTYASEVRTVTSAAARPVVSVQLRAAGALLQAAAPNTARVLTAAAFWSRSRRDSLSSMKHVYRKFSLRGRGCLRREHGGRERRERLELLARRRQAQPGGAALDLDRG